MLTDAHPAATRVTVTIPKDLLRELDHLAIDLGVHRSELAVRLLREAVAMKAREGEE